MKFTRQITIPRIFMYHRLTTIVVFLFSATVHATDPPEELLFFIKHQGSINFTTTSKPKCKQTLEDTALIESNIDVISLTMNIRSDQAYIMTNSICPSHEDPKQKLLCSQTAWVSVDWSDQQNEENRSLKFAYTVTQLIQTSDQNQRVYNKPMDSKQTQMRGVIINFKNKTLEIINIPNPSCPIIVYTGEFRFLKSPKGLEI